MRLFKRTTAIFFLGCLGVVRAFHDAPPYEAWRLAMLACGFLPMLLKKGTFVFPRGYPSFWPKRVFLVSRAQFEACVFLSVSCVVGSALRLCLPLTEQQRSLLPHVHGKPYLLLSELAPGGQRAEIQGVKNIPRAFAVELGRFLRQKHFSRFKVPGSVEKTCAVFVRFRVAATGRGLRDIRVMYWGRSHVFRSRRNNSRRIYPKDNKHFQQRRRYGSEPQRMPGCTVTAHERPCMYVVYIGLLIYSISRV